MHPGQGCKSSWHTRCLGAGVEGWESNPRAKSSVDCRETARENMREIMVGNAGEGVKKREPSCTVGGNIN